MAVARAPGGGGLTGIKVALIVFVCLTVASLAFAVILYTHQADMQAQADDGAKKAQAASGDVSKMRQEVGEIARVVTGESVNEPEKIQKAIAAAVTPVMKDAGVAQAHIAPDSAIVTTLKGLFGLYRATADQLAKTTAERDELVKKMEDLSKTAEQRAKDFDAKTTEFQNRITTLEQQSTSNQQAWTQQVDDLKRRLESSTAQATGSLAKERQARQELEKQVADAKAHSSELADKLAKFQPGLDNVTAEQIADGEVVRSVPVENIVYIGLGKRDRITPGMPFTVYSKPRLGGGMHEKATIEVRNVFDATSECRVTSNKAGEPILDGDIVANLVYDKNKHYRFVVAGNFDLDFDGKIDQPGGVDGQEVAQMIERWGGQVVPTVDSSVDFVVLGAPPPAPIKLPQGATEDAKQRAGEQAKTRAAFDAIRGEAKSMSIPVLTRTQFLRFIGVQIPSKTPEDSVAAQ